MYACSPRWPSDWITKQDLETMLSQLAGTIEPSPHGSTAVSLNHGLHFTGGEPFLNFDLLCQAVTMARDLRIPSTFVETNGFWCTDDHVTRKKLRTLREKGLHGILISVNPFYLEFVPFDRTERAIAASLEVFGRNTMIYQLEYFRRFKEWQIEGTVAFEEYLHTLEPAPDLLRNVEFFMNGRAPFNLGPLLGQVYSRRPARDFLSGSCAPSFLRSWHNHFDNYGNFVPGYCGGISLGDCRRLDRLLIDGIDVAEYPILGYLIEEDLGGLLRFARRYGYCERPEGYLSRCHLCTDIRRHLVHGGEFRELRPREFYCQLEAPLRGAELQSRSDT
jgi:hypothetical protein